MYSCQSCVRKHDISLWYSLGSRQEKVEQDAFDLLAAVTFLRYLSNIIWPCIFHIPFSIMSGYGTTGNQAPTGTAGTHPVQGDPVAAQVGLCLQLMLFVRERDPASGTLCRRRRQRMT